MKDRGSRGAQQGETLRNRRMATCMPDYLVSVALGIAFPRTVTARA